MEPEIKYINGIKVTIHKDPCTDLDDDLLPEYDFDYSKAMPNKYAKILREQRSMNIHLEPELAKYFRDEQQVIQFLNDQIKATRKPVFFDIKGRKLINL